MKRVFGSLVKLSVVSTMLFSASAHAGWSDPVKVTMLDLAPGDGLYVTAAQSWGCGGNLRVRVPKENAMFKEMVSLFMTAHVSGKTVVAHLNCAGDDSEVTRLQIKD